MIIKKEKDEIISYLSDAANFQGNCSEVIFPENESDIIEAVKSANANKVQITVSGNGTGLTGGRVPEKGSVLATDKLNKIISIDADKMKAVVQPGVLLADFKSETAKLGCYYPPDPTEQNCFIGGTIATNASGAKSFKYGSTRNFVERIEVVLPDGDTIALNRGEVFADNFTLELTTNSARKITLNLPEIEMPNVKHAAGYFIKRGMDAIDLFIGAEGTLGVITEAELKLLSLPENFLSAVIFFPDEAKALDFIDDARAKSYESRKPGADSEIDALSLEFFDSNALDFLREDYPNITASHAAAVWFEQETTSGNEDLITEKWINLIEKYGGDLENSWIATDVKERREFQDFRHAVSWKISESLTRNNLRKVGTDTAVPHDKFHEFYYYSKKLVADAGLAFVNYGHFGDSHMHLNMLPKNEEELALAKKLYGTICAKSVALGGTVSAEHGIGKFKREYFELMYPEEQIRKMAKIKKKLDPNLIMNIGNIFSEKFYH